MLPVLILYRTEERRDAGGFHEACHIVLKSNPATCWIQNGNLNLGAVSEAVILVLIGRVVTNTTADAEGVTVLEGVLYATLFRDSNRVVHQAVSLMMRDEGWTPRSQAKYLTISSRRSAGMLSMMD